MIKKIKLNLRVGEYKEECPSCRRLALKGYYCRNCGEPLYRYIPENYLQLRIGEYK